MKRRYWLTLKKADGGFVNQPCWVEGNLVWIYDDPMVKLADVYNVVKGRIYFMKDICEEHKMIHFKEVD